MSTIYSRETSNPAATLLSRPLTNAEIDSNFINLNVDKQEKSDCVTTNTADKVVKRDGSGNFSAGTITATLSGNAATATKSTNIAGGGAGTVPYNTAVDATAHLAAGTSGQVLKSNGAAAPSWETQSNLSVGYSTSAGSATQYNGVNQGQFAPSLKSGYNITGGGTISVDVSGYVNWSARFIIIANSRGTNFATNGYFDITVPAAGSTITGVGGAGNVTTTAAGIPLSAWQAIYYILPLGGTNSSVPGNFRIATYTADLDVPYNWVLLCLKNGDDSLFYFPNGLNFAAGQSGSYTNRIFNSLTVGNAAIGSSGEIRATNSITSWYSDKRLKDEIGRIENALDKVDQLTGVVYRQNKLAEEFGYNNYEEQVGLYAQDVKAVQPQAVKPAPFDTALDDDGVQYSKSGENYLTVQYEKLVPLLVEAIKELRQEVKAIKQKVE